MNNQEKVQQFPGLLAFIIQLSRNDVVWHLHSELDVFKATIIRLSYFFFQNLKILVLIIKLNYHEVIYFYFIDVFGVVVGFPQFFFKYRMPKGGPRWAMCGYRFNTY